jgi:hypothetical protein
MNALMTTGQRRLSCRWIDRAVIRRFCAGLLLTACSDEASPTANTSSPPADTSSPPASTPVASVDAGTVHDEHDMDASSGHVDCSQPYAEDPRDSTMTGELVRIVTSDNGTPDDPSDDEYELLLPQEILDWLKEQNWLQEHGDWHNIRRWDQSCTGTGAGGSCALADTMTKRGLSRAPIQEGEPGDGYDFLVMHRHMIRGLEQAFPRHFEQIRGFRYVPTGKDDPENPIPWIDVRWSADQLEAIDMMENIARHLDLFTSEDDYAKWVQFGDRFAGGFPGGGFPGGGFPGGGFPGFPTRDDAGAPTGFGGVVGAAPPPTVNDAGAGDAGSPFRPEGGIHGPLHGQWSVPGSPSSLVDNNTNVQNFAFWRLHGWIDEMWERYRRAAGLRESDPAYQQALIDQCEEMHELGKASPPEPGSAFGPIPGGQVETGVFATEVAPIFTARCGGSVCHGADSPTLGLSLAGAQASVVREGMVGRPSAELPTMALIEPGEPDQSWLYRKVSGNFDGVDCNIASCSRMPLGGATLTADELERIRSWIATGATAD